MKQMTEYNRVSGYLNKLFDKLNDALFESVLSKPVITIQNTPNAYGHITVNKVWKSGDAYRHELNIGAGTLNRPIEETVATLIHEMVHLYNIANGVRDTSRGYTYHNAKFREEAEKRWLHIEHDKTYGWTITSPTDRLIEWCITERLDEIRIAYNAKGYHGDFDDNDGESVTPKGKPKTSGGKAKTSTRKYICPNCSISVRATKTVSLICGECMQSTGTTVFLEVAQ